MAFEFDTAENRVDISPRSAVVEVGQFIKITSHQRCDAEYRKIKENIEAHEDPDDLETYWHRETLMLDAIHLFDPYVAADLEERFHDHLRDLRAGLASMARNSDW